MAQITQPLREERRALLPHLETLRGVADSVGEVPLESLRWGIDKVVEFLTYHLLPHAQAEDRGLYPVVSRLMGAPDATATMSRDHVEVVRLTEKLAWLRQQLAVAPPGDAEIKALRRVLYGLYALLRVHFAKEEEIYLPMLDARLTEDEAHRMFEAMDEAAREATASQPVK